MTPSPPKLHPRTPTTPMTASKATFFMNKEVEPEMPRTARIRRSTSTRFGAPLTREISAGSNDGVSVTNTECDDGGGRDEDYGYDDGARQSDSSVPDVPEIPGTLSGSTGTGASYSPALTAGEKGTLTPSASSSLPRPPATGGYNTRANASTAKLTGPRPFSHHPSNLTKPRTADGGSSTNNGSESITPKASKHESAPAPTKSGHSVTFSGNPPAIASAARGSPAAKPPSLHIRRRSAGGGDKCS
ncbi:hypothetical protein KEM56_005570 [Ascosphaera pollenicola]|nr:hypothetical protein KEM56_005570 [Ascosphaera pollenicola]